MLVSMVVDDEYIVLTFSVALQQFVVCVRLCVCVCVCVCVANSLSPVGDKRVHF
jgi:hypothetical protein